jgi:hypothetical protein
MSLLADVRSDLPRECIEDLGPGIRRRTLLEIVSAYPQLERSRVTNQPGRSFSAFALT